MDNIQIHTPEVIFLRPNDVILLKVDTTIFTLNQCQELLDSWKKALPNYTILIETQPFVEMTIIRGDTE